MTVRHWGSTASIVIGLSSSAADIANPGPVGGSFPGGLIMFLAGLACRSAKTRNFGDAKRRGVRIIFEALTMSAVLLLWLGQNQLKMRIATDPFPNFVIPVWAVIAYAVAFFRKPRSE